MPELHKLIFCIWIRRLQSVRPVNGFMVSFTHQLQENHSSSGKWVKFFGEAWKGVGVGLAH